MRPAALVVREVVSLAGLVLSDAHTHTHGHCDRVTHVDAYRNSDSCADQHTNGRCHLDADASQHTHASGETYAGADKHARTDVRAYRN